MKTILIATDYSRGANNALEYAAALAKGMEARLVIYNAFNLSISPASVPVSVFSAEDLIRENNERITRIGNKISNAYGIPVECVTTTDVVLDGLYKQVKKQRVDLVVMGMTGNSLLTRLMGSLTTTVIKKAKFPVLVIPTGAQFTGLRRILFACNYEFLRKSTQLETLCAMADAFKAQVQILHVEKELGLVPGDKKPIVSNAPRLEEILRGISHTYRFIYEDNIRDGIKRGIDEFNADMLVMVPHKADFLESLINPSLTREMAFHSRVPLLALPHQKKPVPVKRRVKAEKVAI